MSDVKFQPEGYHTVTPYLAVKDAPALIDFITRVFDGSPIMRMDSPDGSRIMHAEVSVGDSRIMLSEACEQMGPLPAGLFIYVKDVDATYRRALEAGGTSVMEPTDMFWGDRHGSVRDQFGNIWSLATHIEDLSDEEIQQRAREAFADKPS